MKFALYMIGFLAYSSISIKLLRRRQKPERRNGRRIFVFEQTIKFRGLVIFDVITLDPTTYQYELQTQT